MINFPSAMVFNKERTGSFTVPSSKTNHKVSNGTVANQPKLLVADTFTSESINPTKNRSGKEFIGLDMSSCPESIYLGLYDILGNRLSPEIQLLKEAKVNPCWINNITGNYNHLPFEHIQSWLHHINLLDCADFMGKVRQKFEMSPEKLLETPMGLSGSHKALPEQGMKTIASQLTTALAISRTYAEERTNYPDFVWQVPVSRLLPESTGAMWTQQDIAKIAHKDAALTAYTVYSDMRKS